MTNRIFSIREALERLVKATKGLAQAGRPRTQADWSRANQAVADADRALQASTFRSADEVVDGHAVGGRASADYTEALEVYPGLAGRVDAVRWLGMTTHEQLANALSFASYQEDLADSAAEDALVFVGENNRMVALLRQWCDSVDDADCLPTVRQVELRRATEEAIGRSPNCHCDESHQVK